MKNYIEIQGASEHNLKNIDVKIPRDKLVVITGVSGSGKSSLAFDTLYAEGQRRYVESLSAYARQFLEQMPKPHVESIEGLSPAIAIEQKTVSKNPRSTVGTVTEIYDYLRVLFARIGSPHCWICGRPIENMTIPQMVDRVLAMSEATETKKIIILSPVIRDRKGEYQKIFDDLAKDGFVRVKVDGKIYDLEDAPRLDKYKKHSIDVVIDRLVIKPDVRSRLFDSIETAVKHSGGLLKIEDETGKDIIFSEAYACPACGVSFPEMSPRMFSFNNPHGACNMCSGLGMLLEMDPKLVIPDPSISLMDGAIAPWGSPPGRFAKRMIRRIANSLGFDPNLAFSQLDKDVQNGILYGTDRVRRYSRAFEGVIPNLMRRLKDNDSGEVNPWIGKYLGNKECPKCSGSRLKKEVLSVFIDGKNIHEVSSLSVDDVLGFFETLTLSDKNEQIGGKLIKEIVSRATFLKSVGLGYLTLSRAAATLSSGESQRIRLATQIGSSLMGVMYILDEPSIGLHQRDNARLIDTLKQLRDLGNTVIVVEHDENMILEANHVLDMGPGAGEQGGYLVFQGTPEELKKDEKSITGRYLSGKDEIKIPDKRRKAKKAFLKIRGASGNNLKSIDADIPLGLFTCITGVSGSGKSTLIVDTLYPFLAKKFLETKEEPLAVKEIKGLDHIDGIIHIDQSPIGRTPRSNPATYTGVFTYIRELFALLPDAKMKGYQPGRFSFNVKGGRCETCQGGGMIKVEMHFLPDVYILCDQCQGMRFNDETLEVKYKGKSIADVLDMTVHEAYEFFEPVPRIRRKLKTLIDVGMDYIKLGQSATTLSGGEAQRTKLSRELSKKSTGRTVYILDEPTTGLHFDDINKLLSVLQRLVDEGNTVIVIEHNMDVIKCADWLIDLGPEGGEEGGKVIAYGSPEAIMKSPGSYTGIFLKEHL